MTQIDVNDDGQSPRAAGTRTHGLSAILLLTLLSSIAEGQPRILFESTFHDGWFWAYFTYDWEVRNRVGPGSVAIHRICITIPGGTGNISSVGSPPGWNGAIVPPNQICWTIAAVGGGIPPGGVLKGFTADTICNPTVIIGKSAFTVEHTPAGAPIGPFIPIGPGGMTEFALSTSGTRPKTCSISLPPNPAGGQANGASHLAQSGFGQGSGPVEYWLATGTPHLLTQTAPFGTMLLLGGLPRTGAVQLPGLSIDLDLSSGLFCVYDGFGAGLGPPPPSNANPIVLAYNLPPGARGEFTSLQGFSIDPTAPIGISATARNDLGAQDLSTLGPPQTPPFTSATVAPMPAPANLPGHCAGSAQGGPVVGSTNAIFPFARDVICPNIGPVGTEHSLVGSGFNATMSGATSATLNGVPVVITLVRPNEIRFQTTAAHAATIAGPVRVTSTGGTEYKSEDQMELWVFLTSADETSLPVEPYAAGFGGGGVGGVSGTLHPWGGLQAVIGRKDSNNQDDYYAAAGLPSGIPVRAVLAQLDPEGFQVRTQCSGLPPSPPALCYGPNTQPWSQQWFGSVGNCWNDTWLHHGYGNGTGQPGPSNVSLLSSQDDGGPGTTAFFGKPGATATQPAFDADGPIISNGQDWLVASDFGNVYPNPAAVVPYRYVLIVHN